MGKLLRILLTGAFTLAFVPAIGEFFVKLAEENGLYDQPNARVAAVVAMITSRTLYWPLVCFLGGLAVGAWAHFAATKWDRSRNSVPPAIRPITRLKLRMAYDGYAHQEIGQNVVWHQTAVQMDFSGEDGIAKGTALRSDTLSIAFLEPIDYDRPILESFGHEFTVIGSYPLGRNGFVLLFKDMIPPVLDILFPEPGYYDQLSVANASQSGDFPRLVPPLSATETQI